MATKDGCRLLVCQPTHPLPKRGARRYDECSSPDLSSCYTRASPRDDIQTGRVRLSSAAMYTTYRAGYQPTRFNPP